MIRRMLLHSALAAMIVAGAAFSYQVFAKGEAAGAVAGSLTSVLLGGGGDGHDD